MPRPRHLIVIALFALLIASAATLSPPAASRHAAFGGRGIELGRGARTTIVLVHGLGSRAEHWLPVARWLARRHRVELVDLPGHGETDMPEPFSLERATAALDASLAQISNDPVILVGHSLGGLIAAAEAISHPSRIRGLVLVETALRPQIPEAQRAHALERLDHDYSNLIHEAYLGFGRDSAQGEALYHEVAALDPRVVKRWIRLAWSTDLSKQAKSLDLPVLVVLNDRSWGSDESWASVADALGYSGAPRLRAVRLTDCGHFVMLDRPAELATLIEGFAADPERAGVAGRQSLPR